jgi:hypothetical protein
VFNFHHLLVAWPPHRLAPTPFSAFSTYIRHLYCITQANTLPIRTDWLIKSLAHKHHEAETFLRLWKDSRNTPHFCSTSMCINAFTTACHRPLSSGTWIQSTPIHTTSLRSTVTLSNHTLYVKDSHMVSSDQVFWLQFAFMHLLSHLCMLHAHPSQTPWFYHLIIFSKEYEVTQTSRTKHAITDCRLQIVIRWRGSRSCSSLTLQS